MGELQLDMGGFYRIKGKQTAQEVEKNLSSPVNYCFAGAIVPVVECSHYSVQPFDTYKSIAENYGMEEEELKKFNGNRPLYPCCKIFIPL